MDKEEKRKLVAFTAMQSTNIIFNRETGWIGDLEKMIAESMELALKLEKL